MFATSTQRHFWMFKDETDVSNARLSANLKYISSRGRNMTVAERETHFLNVVEEKSLIMSYEYQLRDFCRKFHPPMPRYVLGTALHYLKRFYVNNSVMDYPPKEILVTCVYLACKVEEFNVSMDQFVGNLKGDREKAAAIILNNELLLMQQLDYQLTVHNPFRPLEGLMIDMKTRFPTFSDPERLRPGIDEFLEQVFYTDAILIYSPSQISLAAIIHSASTSKENVDEYITKILFSEDQKRLLNLIEAVKKIRVMVRNVQLPHRDTIKALEKKLALCCNPDNNSESPAFKKRMKQSFDEEESFEDGQYPSASSDQVRSMLMGLSEMGKI
uniref:Cyclin-H n=1 Tax=Daphnia similis TaxID=35528 RepID=A0A4Y7LWM9_9CRUS|nr:EOG090X080D [Daphnia similis]SVE71112.1 EOG090X080D [Daphnia similis]SVE71743.1 EOG090X080D [Daphnia similis]SVE72371.1 EOG090X080D [Daphnia similis]